MGIAINVYFPNDMVSLVNSLDKGEISKICQGAVKEHFSLKKKSPEEIEAKLREIEYEKQRQEKEEEILKKQLEEAKQEEAEREKEEREKNEKAQKKRQEKINSLNDFFVEHLGRDMTEEDLDNYEQSDCKTILEFIDKLKEANK